jgi:hypothetical protein
MNLRTSQNSHLRAKQTASDYTAIAVETGKLGASIGPEDAALAVR